MSERHAFQSIPANILLPIEFSPSSQAALETAADLALPFHAELLLLNFVPLFSAFTSEYAAPRCSFNRGRRRVLSSVWRRLEQFSPPKE
jgi:hypothetical protein